MPELRQQVTASWCCICDALDACTQRYMQDEETCDELGADTSDVLFDGFVTHLVVTWTM